MAGSGYTRQSVASIVPTAVVRAAPIKAEFDKLRDAFTQSDTGTTGHRHDGSSDEGSYVPFIADLDKQNYLTHQKRWRIRIRMVSSMQQMMHC